MRRIPSRLWLWIVLSALLQSLPFPISGPMPVWRAIFSWFALTPLLFALGQDGKPGECLTRLQGGALGYVTGILWYLGNCYWIYQTMYLYGGLEKPIAVLILLLFCLYLGLYHAVFSAIFVTLRNSRLGFQGALAVSPFLWVAVELARARITGFPWDLLGNTQIDNAVLVRLAPYTGVYGLSFFVATINAIWLMRFKVRQRSGLPIAFFFGALLCLVLCGWTAYRLRLPPLTRARESAILLQENLGVGTTADLNVETPLQMLDAFSDLSLHPPGDFCFGLPELPSTRCVRFPTDQSGSTVTPVVPATVIAWPESPSGFISEDPQFAERMRRLAVQANSPLVVGSIGMFRDPTDKNIRKYDSGALFSAAGEYKGRYDKIHLVPWGEYIPFKDLFFFAKKLTAGVGDMDRGTQRTVFRTGGHAFGVFICYESIFGDEVRQFVKNGAEVLVNLSDDGWYGDTSAAWEHLNMVRMRAVENHRWILRSTNTGVTTAIDPYGRVTVSAERHIRTALKVGFNFEHEVTFYTRHGDWFAYLCVVVSALALAYSFVRRDGLN